MPQVGRLSGAVEFTELLAMFCIFFNFKILFIYLLETERQRRRQREKQAPCREPDAGLNPGTWGHALG